jgi:alpha-glucosidase
MAAFTPLCRDHSNKDSKPRELWVNGPEPEAIRRRYIETRYRLLPYIYSLADESSRTGLPMMRPVFLEFPEIISTGGEHYDTEFLLGPSLLIAPPPFAEMQDGYAVGLPQSAPWFDFWTGLKMPPVPIAPPIAEIVTATTPLKFPEQIHPAHDTMPVYVRGGSIVPLQPLIQNTDEVPTGPLELDVYPGPKCAGNLYLDDGHTFAYQQGAFLRQTLTCESEAGSMKVKFSAREGSYAPWWKTVEVVIYDWPSSKAEARLSSAGAPLKTSYDLKKHALHVAIPDAAAQAELTVLSR